MSTFPLVEKTRISTKAVAQAETGATVVATAPYASTVTAATYVPNDAITGADNNTRKVSLINKGPDGNGTTEVAALQFDNGTDVAAFDAISVPLSTTAEDLELTSGDVLAWESDNVGTGLADPGGMVTVTFARA